MRPSRHGALRPGSAVVGQPSGGCIMCVPGDTLEHLVTTCAYIGHFVTTRRPLSSRSSLKVRQLGATLRRSGRGCAAVAHRLLSGGESTNVQSSERGNSMPQRLTHTTSTSTRTRHAHIACERAVYHQQETSPCVRPDHDGSFFCIQLCPGTP